MTDTKVRPAAEVHEVLTEVIRYVRAGGSLNNGRAEILLDDWRGAVAAQARAEVVREMREFIKRFATAPGHRAGIYTLSELDRAISVRFGSPDKTKPPTGASQ